jgi:glycerol-3-phosphate dehydrogenase (NAD(P)+)
MKFCVVGAGAWGTAFALHLARGARPCACAAPARAGRGDRRGPREPRVPPRDRAAPGRRGRGDLTEGLSGPTSSFSRARPDAAPDGRQRPRRAGRAPSPASSSASRRASSSAATCGPRRRSPRRSRGSWSAPSRARPTRPRSRAACPRRWCSRRRGDDAVVQEVQAAISGPTLRVYTTDDLPGVEFGGSLKNIYAIAAGCCEGLGLGDNAKAALMTRAVRRWCGSAARSAPAGRPSTA